MRYLTIDEICKEANYVISEAVIEANKSVCQKSKRGAVIVKYSEIIGRGFNNPPKGYDCDGVLCRKICNKYCIHAEQNAIFDALTQGSGIRGSRMYHIKVKEEIAVTSGAPSCTDCSKLVLDRGVLEFVLWHEKGYGVYEAGEFHRLSLESIGHKA